MNIILSTLQPFSKHLLRESPTSLIQMYKQFTFCLFAWYSHSSSPQVLLESCCTVLGRPDSCVLSSGLLGATQTGRLGVCWALDGEAAQLRKGCGTQPLCPSGENRPFYLLGSSGTEKLPIITQIADFCHPNCEWETEGRWIHVG